MAIFSLRHTWLGKSHKDYKPGAGKAHANYITRESSCTKIIAGRAPTNRHAVKDWLDREETSDRKNARIVDKLMIALPIELTIQQREALVREFCERASQGRASWVAAFHEQGKDAHNPHVHIVFRDRDVETGRRVMLTTERGSTERFRQQWEETANFALQRAGLSVRIDRRTLAAQGLDREAGVHRGPQAPTRTQTPPARSRNVFEEEPKKRKASLPRSQADHSFDWTSRGSLVAQQWSAVKWAREAHERANRNPFNRTEGLESGEEKPHTHDNSSRSR